MTTQKIIYQVDSEDLIMFAEKIMCDTKKQLLADLEAGKIERYLTGTEVCEMLSVEATTLWRWCKRGYITPIKIGGKTRYRLSDVKQIAEGGR